MITIGKDGQITKKSLDGVDSRVTRPMWDMWKDVYQKTTTTQDSNGQPKKIWDMWKDATTTHDKNG